MSQFTTFLTLSRPRFWIYTFGPYLIGATHALLSGKDLRLLILFGFFFLIPANLLIYGVNDLFDWETDQHNPKKQKYESLLRPEVHKKTALLLALCVLPFLIPLLWVPTLAVWMMVGFLFLGVFYSATPIRAKARPFLDSFFNGLYVMPALFGLALSHEWAFFVERWEVIAAAWLWVMAMHAYSAVPDIAADKKGKVATIATVLGAKKTLLFCALCYIWAVVLSFSAIGTTVVVFGVIYLALLLMSLSVVHDRQALMVVYSRFPAINSLVGFCLFAINFFAVASVVLN